MYHYLDVAFYRLPPERVEDASKWVRPVVKADVLAERIARARALKEMQNGR